MNTVTLSRQSAKWMALEIEETCLALIVRTSRLEGLHGEDFVEAFRSEMNRQRKHPDLAAAQSAEDDLEFFESELAEIYIETSRSLGWHNTRAYIERELAEHAA